MSRDLRNELNKALPANYHCQLGTLIEEMINTFNYSGNKPTKQSLGTPAVGSTNALISAATSTEVPNNATITYTGLTDNTSPLDGSIAAPTTILMNNGTQALVYSLDSARNVSAVVTATAVAAMTITLNGYDINKNSLQEILTIPGSTASRTVAGLKAFKYLESFVLTSAVDATGNTVNLGYGEVLGLPFILTEKSGLLQTWFNQVVEATVPTVVVADTSAVTATTGDPRGTIDLSTTLNGSAVSVWMQGGSDYLALRQVVPLSLR
jgi:hypothetical protein